MSCLHWRSLLATMADIICLVLGVVVASRPLTQQNQPPFLYYTLGALCPLGLVFVGITPIHIKNITLGKVVSTSKTLESGNKHWWK